MERFNSILCQSLSMYAVAKNQKNWDDFIPLISFAHLTSISEAIGDFPLYYLYGREPRLPVDVKFLLPAADDLSTFRSSQAHCRKGGISSESSS